MTTPTLTLAEVERFHAQITRGPGCWPWTGETNNRGYGRFTIYRDGRRVRILTHRLAYTLATGTDPGEAKLRHRCDNPPCCNPMDLVTGTQADNMQDAVLRNRLDTSGLTAYRAACARAAAELLAEGKKRCCTCKIIQPVDRFYRSRSTHDGLHASCKGCCAEMQRNRRRSKRHPVLGT